MQWILPALFGFLGSIVGSASAILGLYLSQKLAMRNDLAKHRRMKGEVLIADLAELTIWSGDVIRNALSGEIKVHLPKQIFSVEASIQLYFANHAQHTYPLAKEAADFAMAAAHIAVEIKQGKTVNEKSDEIRTKAKPFTNMVEMLKRAVIAELRVDSFAGATAPRT